MARKWLRLMLVLGLVSVLIQCTDCKDEEEESLLTLESWVAAIRAPAPAPRKQNSSPLAHRVSEDAELDAEDTSDQGRTKLEAESKHDHREGNTASAKEDATDEGESSKAYEGSDGHDSGSVRESGNKPNTKGQLDEELEDTANVNNGERPPATNISGEGELPQEAKVVNATLKTSKETSEANSSKLEGSTDGHQESEAVSDKPKGEEATSTLSTSVATARMLLVTDGLTSVSNLSSNADLLTWRLTDSNLLDDIANKILASEEDEVIANPNRSGELADGKHKPKFNEAASKVIETRVLPPGHFRNNSRKESCNHQNSWACLSRKERIQLRQKLLKDLETSYNAPLPARIRYRLKKKPSVYTSKKPNTRFDIGIPDIYETEVQVTPKYRRNPNEARPTVGYPKNDYRVAADRSHHQYLPTPSGPSYLPLGALVTPAYSTGNVGTAVTTPFIPLNRNYEDEQSPGLVFRPPRRPPGINRRRTDGILRRPIPGKPHFFTTTPDRVSLQTHLQYRRPVAFKFKRTGGGSDHHDDSYTDPTTRIYTTAPYPTITTGKPYSVTPHPETKSSQHYEEPTTGYTKPPEKYIPPNNEYVPPKPPHKTPSHDHNPPAKVPVKVSQNYLPPNKEYEVPHHKQPTPTAYTEPPQRYVPPSKAYVAPHVEQKPPTKPHSKPIAEYQPPTQEYVTPESHKPGSHPYTDLPRTYIPPNKGYSAPHVDHTLPAKVYAQPPPTNYELPRNEYIPPKSPHQLSSVDHKPTHKEYDEPPSKYTPPNKEYIAPVRPKQPEGGYTVPPGKYSLPNRPYVPTRKTPGNGQPHRRRRPGKRRRKKGKRPTAPSRNYLPPNKEADGMVHDDHDSKLSLGHKVPANTYVPPNKAYVPPKADNLKHPDPLPVTTVSSIFYTPPARTYLPPVDEYRAPQKHTTPSPTYGPPSKEYVSHPKEDYALPHYAGATPEYVAPLPPNPTYGPPSQKYELPIRDYVITPPKPEPHDTALPGWLMSLQGKTPMLNPTPPPGYHPNHSTREEYYPGTQSKPIYSSPKPGHITALPEYAPPMKDVYVPPKEDYHAHGHLHSMYNVPEPTYRPSKGDHPILLDIPGYYSPVPAYKPPTHGHSASEQIYKPPVAEHHLEPPYHTPANTYKAPVHPVTTFSPTYSEPPRTYLPPIQEYVPPNNDYHSTTTAYVPPKTLAKAPHQDVYVPPRAPPKTSYHSSPPPHLHIPLPKPDYVEPAPPVQEYIPPKSPGIVVSPKAHQQHSLVSDPPHVTTYTTTYKPPVYPVTTSSPTYSEPPRTYVPPFKDYLPPNKDYAATTPAYVPPKIPAEALQADVYIPPTDPPKTYLPPPPPLHIPIDLSYLPPVEKPLSSYIPPLQEYLAPASLDTHSTSHPLDLHLAYLDAPHKHPKPAITLEPDYAPPTHPNLEYVPPVTPKPHLATISSIEVPAKPSPKPDYVPPPPPKQKYIPPSLPFHVTTYKPNVNSKVQKLQDFSYPGMGKVSHPTRLPHGIGNISVTTYSPPVYTPSTFGPGYNDLPPSAIPAIRPPPPHPLPQPFSDYDDDYYYYYDYDDDDYYYYEDDDDDDYYYYYYDDYDYGLPQQRPPIPHHLIPNSDYDILDNEIYDFGYIAGIPGRAGRDYPILSYIPLTSFGCDLVADYPGYYADMEAGCQVFHICHRSGRQDSFLCPNGTIFNQKYFVCDWWYNFACEDAPFFYPVNAALGHPGVPLHRNAFEPNLEAARHLPPLENHPAQQPQHHLALLNHATPRPFLQHAEPIPHHLAQPPHGLGLAPHLF